MPAGKQEKSNYLLEKFGKCARQMMPYVIWNNSAGWIPLYILRSLCRRTISTRDLPAKKLPLVRVLAMASLPLPSGELMKALNLFEMLTWRADESFESIRNVDIAMNFYLKFSLQLLRTHRGSWAVNLAPTAPNYTKKPSSLLSPWNNLCFASRPKNTNFEYCLIHCKQPCWNKNFRD